MIHPNIVIYETRPIELKNRKSIPVIQLPLNAGSNSTDRCIIDQIRNQPKPNELSDLTTSPFKTDIAQSVKLAGSFCNKTSTVEIVKTITEIHETLNNKATPELKNWLRLLTGIHPEVDKQIRSLGYWKMPYSEVIGTNTILYYAGPDAVDIFYWAAKPQYTSNEVGTVSNNACSYIRESVRQKLDTVAVEMIQNANHMTTKNMRRNLIWESKLTTAKGSGAEITQSRPIAPAKTHGASLNNDWYHGTYRVSPMRGACRSDVITHLRSGGYNVDLLVNHLTPLTNTCKAQSVAARFESPLGIEETFPRRSSALKADIDNSGQPVLKKPTSINNDVIKPEIIKYE